MKKKLIAISCMMLMLIIGLPTIQAQETTDGIFFDRMSLAHVSIQGSGNEFMISDHFNLGIGRCAFMRIALNEDGHVEINKFLDSSNITILDGSHVVYLIGFFGYHQHTTTFNINGVAILAIWR